ncbi:MAG: DUF4303 domain-containing protein [Pseudomonadota bacterium]
MEQLSSHPTPKELAASIAAAMRLALLDLFRQHPEQYYYFSLVTTGEALPPFLVAWSTEALVVEVAKAKPGSEAYLRWSCAESPYMCYGEHHFQEVIRLFELRPEMTSEMTDSEWEAEYAVRLRAMELAMKELDDEGVFSQRGDREKVVINVEVMPPDATNAERARRLNPVGSQALAAWLQDVAEE